MDAKRLELLCDYYGGPPGDFVNGDRFCEKWGDLRESETPTHEERNAVLAMLARLAPLLDRLAAEWELGNGLGKGGVDEDTVRTLVDAWGAAP